MQTELRDGQLREPVRSNDLMEQMAGRAPSSPTRRRRDRLGAGQLGQAAAQATSDRFTAETSNHRDAWRGLGQAEPAAPGSLDWFDDHRPGRRRRPILPVALDVPNGPS